MKFSVVTISFNQAPYLRECLESVLGQEGVDIEYIVVDAGSTDGSREIIDQYRSRISNVIFEPDAGPSDGLNKGLALASGDYFYYLNSDDVVSPGTFLEAAKILQSDPSIDVLYGNGVAVDSNTSHLRKIYSAQLYTANLAARGLAVIVQQSSFVRTSKLKEIGGFNLQNRVSWDGEAFFELARAGARFKRVWKFWGLFRIYPDTISGGGAALAKNELVHKRLRSSLGIAEGTGRKLADLITRALLRVADIRRWPSYLLGSVRPHNMASKL